VHGLDLAEPQDDATLSAPRAVLLDWKVLFFRDQNSTTEQHVALAGQLQRSAGSPIPRWSRFSG
jgi:taurine dioxygenase